MSNYKQFAQLHHNGLLILPNAWDARSAKIFEESGYAAVGTSSSAVSAALGYPDGEGMPFEEYLGVIKRIAVTVKIPFTVDMEMGYGDNPDSISANLIRLAELGVVGINIEDSQVEDGMRSLRDASAFAATLAAIRSNLAANGIDLFINVRCDTHLLNVTAARRETADRIRLYEDAGADAIFLPGIVKEEDIAAAAKQTRLPLNVMCVPGLPDFNRLEQLSVKRVSMGPFLCNAVYKQAATYARTIEQAGNFNIILS